MIPARLRQSILDEIGIDIYSSQTDGRYFLSELIQSAIVLACVTEFAKGFFDFKELGTATRQQLLALAADFRAGHSLDSHTDAGEFTALWDAMRRNAGPALSTERRARGEHELNAALIEFGMEADVAQEHAKKIADLIVDGLKR